MIFPRPADLNLSTRLFQTLTPELGAFLHRVADAAAGRGLPLYLVGGFVRDFILGRPVTDFDLVVEGDAIAFAKGLVAQFGGKVTAHTHFGTTQWSLPTSLIVTQGSSASSGFRLSTLDLISARSESYKHPAALPAVIPGTMADDLRRRDFTINTLALRLDGDHFGELHDSHGGMEDLKAGIVRVLYNGSFVDDPTRIFRAVRYEQRYGFKISTETLGLIPEALKFIDKLSAHRIRHELDLIMEEEIAASMMKRLAKLGILAAVHPALEWKPVTQKRFMNGVAAASTIEHPPPRRKLGWTLWLMDVPLPGIKSIEKRLHFESSLRDVLLGASALFTELNSFSSKKPSRYVAYLEGFPLQAVQAVFAGLSRQELYDYLETWRFVRPKTTGHDLKMRGLTPGPAYKAILQRLRTAWLDGEVKTVDEEMVLLDKLMKESTFAIQ